MKITRVIFCLFTLLLALVAFAFAPSVLQTHAAGSGRVTKFRFHGLSAFATFDSVSGCVETFVNVDGTQSGKSSVADVFIGQFDNCTGATLLSASGTTSSAAFQVGHMLASGSLQGAIPVFDDVSGTRFKASVNITWTATGPLARENQHFHFQSKGFIDNFHLNAAFRDATASGTIFIGTTNFTPEPSLFAQIASVKEGEVIIMHS